MIPPQPMLSVCARRWPDGGRWVLQPKWDGFRLLLHVGADGEGRAWSRRGTNLTARLGPLLAPLTEVAPGTTFDGELVAVSERDGKPAQDFAAVTRAVFTGHAVSTQRLRFVAFDVLSAAGQDLRPCAWEERDARLRETLPVCDLIRLVASQPATLAAHEAIVALGFEGTVLKRMGSVTDPDDTANGSNGRHGSRLGLGCIRSTKTARAAGTPSASSMAAVSTRSLPPAPPGGSGSSSSWSTRASTPMAACGRPASRPYRDGWPSRLTYTRAKNPQRRLNDPGRRGPGRRPSAVQIGSRGRCRQTWLPPLQNGQVCLRLKPRRPGNAVRPSLPPARSAPAACPAGPGATP